MAKRKPNLKRKSLTVTDPNEALKELPVTRRIELPLIWARIECGVRVIDLQEHRYNEALALFKEHYIYEEVLCKASNLSEEEESIEGFLDTVRFWFKNTMSMIAVTEGTNDIVGVIVCGVVNRLDHTRTLSRLRPVRCGQLVPGRALEKVMTFRSHLHKECDLFEMYDVEEYFRIYAIVVIPNKRGKGIGMALMKSALRLARLLEEPLIMGLFTSARSQSMAAKLGMETDYEMYYVNWLDDNEIVFEDPGPGNYSAMMMSMKLKR